MRAAIPAFSVPERATVAAVLVDLASVALLRLPRVGGRGGGARDSLADSALVEGTETRELRRSAVTVVVVVLTTVSGASEIDAVASGTSTNDDDVGSDGGCGDDEAAETAETGTVGVDVVGVEGRVIIGGSDTGIAIGETGDSDEVID